MNTRQKKQLRKHLEGEDTDWTGWREVVMHWGHPVCLSNGESLIPLPCCPSSPHGAISEPKKRKEAWVKNDVSTSVTLQYSFPIFFVGCFSHWTNYSFFLCFALFPLEFAFWACAFCENTYQSNLTFKWHSDFACCITSGCQLPDGHSRKSLLSLPLLKTFAFLGS